MVINSSAQKIYRMYVTVKKHLTFPWLPQCISETKIICTVIVQHQTNQRNKNIRWPGMNKGYISAQQVGKLYVGPIFFLNKGLSSRSLQYGPRPAWHDINIYQFMTLQISSNYSSWKYCKHNPLLKDVFIKLKHRIKIRSLKRIGYIQVI